MKKQVSVLAAAGLAVATAFGGVAFALSGNGDEQPARDTVPVGQLVDVPVSSTPGSLVTPPAVATDPIAKDTTVTNQPAQPAQQQLVDEPTDTPPPATTMPTAPENGAPLNPAPAPVPPPPGTNPNDAPNPDPAPAP